MGIKPTSFSHYVFDAGENKGDAPTYLSKSELSRSLNVENRANGLATRFGSLILSLSGSLPNPILGNPVITDIFEFDYNTTNFETLFTGGSSIYRTPNLPVALKTGLSSGRRFQGQKVENFFYLTNGIDPVQFYDPARSNVTTYTAGYDTPAAFIATPSALGGSMATGTYEYYVILYDQNTETKSNIQDVPVSAVVVGPTGSVTLTNLPIDPENRTTHWIIFRKDPTGFYHYRLATVPYNSAVPTYTDTALLTGNLEIAPNDNDKPDPSDVICLHGNIMVYAKGNVITWSKTFRHQDVPTYNRETLSDTSEEVTKMVSYRGALVIWKTTTMYVILGDLNSDNYEIRKISTKLGTRSPKTVQEAPDGIYFLDSQKKPRMINSTDFNADDLRESSDISYKYRLKFNRISEAALPYCFAVLWDTSLVSQYRLFVPVDTSYTYPNHCYVLDYGLKNRNRGDSAWFDFQYNMNLSCAAVVKTSQSSTQLQAGDDYGLVWQIDAPLTFYDGDLVFREEGDGTVTFGANTINCSNLSMVVNQFVGVQLILYNQYSYQEIFRSRIISNTATQFTLQDPVPALPTADPAVCVGGYLTFFATANYTHKRYSQCAPFRASVLFGIDFPVSKVQFFTHYDFNEVFNLNYDYINNPANPSLTPLADNYDLIIGTINALYDFALYDVDKYGGVLYDTAEFFLNSEYFFKHIAWGIVTREPNAPFNYLGATVAFQPKGWMGQ